MHYQRHIAGSPMDAPRKGGGLECGYTGCGRPAAAKGWCIQHRRQELAGKALRPIREKTPGEWGAWGISGKYVRRQRTIEGRKESQWMHYQVWEEHHGRKTASHETIHHINRNPLDNRIENLQLRQGAHGKGATFICHDCGSRNVEAIELD